MNVQKALLLASTVLALAATGYSAEIRDTGPLSRETYDDFDEPNLDTTRWVVELPKDAKRATAHVAEGDLRVYGNGRWAEVTSKRHWRLPWPGENGMLRITCQVRPWQLGKYGEKNICDSEIYLAGDHDDRNRIQFGFRITFPERSAGNYLLLAGRDPDGVHKSTWPVGGDVQKYDYLRITIGRDVEGGLCELAASKDGRSWQTLHRSRPPLPETVRLNIRAAWGHMAVGSVVIEQPAAAKRKARLTDGSDHRAAPRETKTPDASADFIPVVYVSKLALGQQPEIDGRMDDPAWKALPRISLKCVSPRWPAPVTQPTEASVGYDEKNLYVAFSCGEDSMDRIWMVQKTGGPIWSDDCVELFVQAGSPDSSSDVFHAAVNSRGRNVDESGAYAKWSCAAVRQRTSWSVEMAIPFSVIGRFPSPGECWSINFNRQERPHGENSTWAPVRGSFHDTEKYGRIVFGTSPVRIDGFASRANAGTTPGGLVVRLSSNGSVTGSVTIESRWDQSFGETKTVSADTQTAVIPWPRSLATGYHKSTLKLTVPGAAPITISGGRIWVDQGLPLASTFWPTEDYDNVLYLADGRMNYLYWIVSDTRGGREGYTATLEVPEWVEVFPLPKKGEPGYYSYLPEITEFKSEKLSDNGGTFRRIMIAAGSPPQSKELSVLPEYNSPFHLWLRATAPKMARLPLNSRIKFWISRKGLTEPAHEIPLVVLPRVDGTAPRRFPIFAWTNGPTYPKPLWQDLAAHYESIGLNGLMGAPSGPDFEAVARSHHLATLDYCPGFCESKAYLAKHPDHAAAEFNGKASKTLICPEISLQDNSPAFEQASSFLNRYCPPLGLNWDLEGPPIWNVCFCPRCLAAFRTHAGLKPDVPLTPKSIQSDPALNKAWTDFALEQSKRMVIKWDQRIAQARPGARLFVNGGQATNPRVITDGRLDWRRILPCVGAGQMFRYCGSPQASATSFHTESVRSLELIEGAAATPMIAVLTTGYMRVGERMVFDYPGLTTLQMVQMAAIGFDGIYYWHWYNNDGRFDNAIARGTTIIAKYEDFFVDGEKLPVPAEAVRKSEYTLVLGRTHGKRAVLFLLNFDPHRQAEIAIQFEKILPGEKWHLPSGEDAARPPSAIRVPPLDLVILVGEQENP